MKETLTLQIETIPAKDFAKNRKAKNCSLNALRKIQVESCYTKKVVDIISLQSTTFAINFNLFPPKESRKCCLAAI